MQPLLTIGITSYKRIKELIRCINSIDTKYVDDIEILVSEDHSPLSSEIKREVEKIAETSKYKVIFSSNERNLGYDMNLGSIINKSNGKYVFLMSDDDMIYPKSLDNVIDLLRTSNDYGVVYAPFVYEYSGKRDRYRAKSFQITAGENSAAKYLYDSILFSGLIFRKEFVIGLDASRFVNYNYFQVYMFLYVLYKFGGYYLETPTVLCVGDGENAYGLSESSGGNAILANRKSVKSNLEFNKTLIKTIKMFDDDMKTNILKSFEWQYSLHSYSGLSIARDEGIKYFNEYWNILNSLDVKLHFITKVYYFILLIFGRSMSDNILLRFKKFIKKE